MKGTTTKGIVINDIHFGVKESERIYRELHQVTDYLRNNEIDWVIIAGDYFDHKLSIGDPASFYAISFFNELYEICKEKSIKLRFIKGTTGHELNQLQLFYPFTNSTEIDFRIIEEVSEEELESRFNVLYIPEEYPENADEYYAPFKEKSYNGIFGHGTWEFVAFNSQIEHGDRTDLHSAPVFKYSEWENAIKDGFVSFGHIHSRNKYRNKIFYSGSFSRWDFSDISERGFSVIEYDTESKKFSLEFLNNDEAPVFDSYILKDRMQNSLENFSIEDLIVFIDATAEKANFVSVDCVGISKENLELLKAHYRDSNIKIRSSERKTMLKESVDEEKKFEKFAYITKKQLPLNETIKKFAKEELNKEISLEDIEKVIGK